MSMNKPIVTASDLRNVHPFITEDQANTLLSFYNREMDSLALPETWDRWMPGCFTPGFLAEQYAEYAGSLTLGPNLLLEIVAPPLFSVLMGLKGMDSTFRVYMDNFAKDARDRATMKLIGVPPKFLKDFYVAKYYEEERRRFAALLGHKITSDKGAPLVKHILRPRPRQMHADDRAAAVYRLALRDALFPIPVMHKDKRKNIRTGGVKSKRIKDFSRLASTTYDISTFIPYKSPTVLKFLDPDSAEGFTQPINARPVFIMEDVPDYTPATLDTAFGIHSTVHKYPVLASFRIPHRDPTHKSMITVKNKTSGVKTHATSYTHLETLLEDADNEICYCQYVGVRNPRIGYSGETKLVRDIKAKIPLAPWVQRFATFVHLLQPCIHPRRLLDKSSWYTMDEVEKWHVNGCDDYARSSHINFVSRDNEGAEFYKHKRRLDTPRPFRISHGLREKYVKPKKKPAPFVPFKILPLVSKTSMKLCETLQTCINTMTITEQLYLHHAFAAARGEAKSIYPTVISDGVNPPATPMRLTPLDVLTRSLSEVHAITGFSGNHYDYMDYVKSLSFSRAAAYEDVNVPPDVFQIKFKRYDLERNRGTFSANGVPATFDDTTIETHYRGWPTYALRYFEDEEADEAAATSWHNFVVKTGGSPIIMDDQALAERGEAFVKHVQSLHNTKMLAHGTRRDMMERL